MLIKQYGSTGVLPSDRLPTPHTLEKGADHDLTRHSALPHIYYLATPSPTPKLPPQVEAMRKKQVVLFILTFETEKKLPDGLDAVASILCDWLAGR